MASPTVRGRTAPAAGLSATSPAGTAVGDMVIVFTWERAGAGVPTHTLQANFVEIISHSHDDGSTDGRLSVGYKIATASGANSYQAYTSSNGTETWTGIVVITVGTFAATALNKGPIASAGVTQTNNAVPNPPSVTLGNNRDWLVIVAAGWHHSTSTTITPTAPTNYNNLIEVAGASTGDLGIADRSLSAPVSEDPGTFGDNIAPNGTAIVTIGIASVLAVTRSVAIGGTGTVSAAGTFLSIFSRSAAVNGASSIAASGTVTPGVTEHERSIGLDATGLIASSGVFFSVVSGTAAIDGVGSIASTGAFLSVYERAAAFGGGGGITTAGFQRELLRSSVIDGSGAVAITGSGFSILERGASLNADATIASLGNGFSVLTRSVIVDGTAIISVVGQRDVLRSAVIDGDGNVSVSGSVAGAPIERSAGLDGAAVITSAGEFFSIVQRSVILDGASGISVSGEIAPPGVVAHERSTLFSAAGSVAGNGELFSVFERTSVVAGAGSISVSFQRDFQRSANLLATASVSVTIVRELQAARAYVTRVEETDFIAEVEAERIVRVPA